MLPSSRTLGELLDELAIKFGNKDALFFENEILSFREWNEKSQLFAKGLYQLGIRKGDRLGLLMSNRNEWFISTFAAAKLGAVIVGLNTWYKPSDLEYVLHHSGARMLIMIDRFLKNDYLQHLKEMLPEMKSGGWISSKLPELQNVIVQGGNSPDGAHSFEQIIETGKAVSDEVLNSQKPSPEDMMYILYTSGTTAKPKGVTLLHYGLIENGYNIGERQRLEENDRLWLCVPLFFSLGSANAIMAALTHGAGIVNQESFEPGEAIRLINKRKCSIFYGMPVMIHAMYDHPDRAKYDLSSLQKGVTIGSSETINRCIELVPHISNVYGSTETYGNCCVTDGHDDIARRIRSQGKPLPGNQIKIVDLENRTVLPPGETGEVCVRGYITPGYYQDPVNNENSFDQEGFYITGDLGFLDGDGYFHYVGRVKDMIKTGGINVSPLAVEESLYEHPDVKEVHVFGVPDEVKDEVVMAIIELKKGSKATEADISNFCKECLPSYSVPKYIEFWKRKQFPRTDTGKVAKRDLKAIIFSRVNR